ncbi:Transcription factor MYBS3 [Glycine soja]|uniref:Transcription factor MYBS3 n=1 Tax=Glycine soja TaxID=3848 RepID=A0A445FQB3_GLYSO|nr:Transcription factor MYBS3 [Glycine soja]
MEAPKYDNGSNDESSSSTPSFSNNQEDQEEPLVPGGFSNPLKTHDSYVQVSNSYPHHLPSQNIEEANCIMLSGGSDDSSVSLCCQKYTHWTKEHHMSFLLGLEKCGQGEEKWKKISTYFLTSKTLTQIVSHVQKYFLRKNVPEKGRRRRSIHDMIPL